jgi:hypothetical protein
MTGVPGAFRPVFALALTSIALPLLACSGPATTKPPLPPDAAAGPVADAGRLPDVAPPADASEDRPALDRPAFDADASDPCRLLAEDTCAGRAGCIAISGQLADLERCRLAEMATFLACVTGQQPDGGVIWGMIWVHHPVTGGIYRVFGPIPPPGWQRVSQPGCSPDAGAGAAPAARPAGWW